MPDQPSKPTSRPIRRQGTVDAESVLTSEPATDTPNSVQATSADLGQTHPDVVKSCPAAGESVADVASISQALTSIGVPSSMQQTAVSAPREPVSPRDQKISQLGDYKLLRTLG